MENEPGPAIKKVLRWQVAVKHWSQVSGGKDNLLINQIQNMLGPSTFDMEALLFYFRMDMGEIPHAIKKNGRQIAFNRGTGRPVLGKSGDLVRAEKSMIAQMQLQARGQRLTKPFEGRLWVMAHFYFPHERYYTKTGQVSETLPDLSNLLELPQDCMQPVKVCKTGQRKGRTIRNGAGIISNDSHIDSLDGCRRLPGESYRLEIFLMRYKGHEPNPIK